MNVYLSVLPSVNITKPAIMTIWNCVPPAMVNASSILCIKRRLSNVDLPTTTYCTYFL